MNRALAFALVLGIAPLARAQNVVLDDFTDNAVVLNSAGQVVGAEGPSSAYGGWRAFYFYNSSGFGTLTLDPTIGTFQIASNGLGQSTIGYGDRLGPGGNSLIGYSTNALNADWTGFSGFRFFIAHNDGHLRLVVTLVTYSGRYSSTPLTLVTTPSGGTWDLPFSSIPATSGGGVNYADIDLVEISVYNGSVGETVALDKIELIAIPPTPGDIDGNHTVDLNDAVALVNVLLGTPLHSGDTARADLNNDGIADGRDIQFFLDDLLGP